ncbi:hypothetical protein ZWY2020_031691 [Hordeum vulgare]|nr:hypothetical protein ZWY2020_031691 [Hordeum vulgare]
MHTWFMVFIWAWCLPLMLAVTAAEEQQGGGCSAKCGNFTISDPFWLTDWETGRSCGSPGLPDFQLTCFNKNYPVLPSSVPNSPSFRIIDVSYGERSLRVIDLGKMPLSHRASNSFNSCLPIWNTSVILGRSFRISPTNLGLILYNCTEGAPAEARREKELLQATTMRCMNTSNTFVRAGVPYDPTGNYSGYALEGCVATVVPVLRLPSGQTNAGNYERLIDDGFLLTWDLPPSPPVVTSAAGILLFICTYVLIWHRKGKRLWFLLCKKTSSNTEKNYEAMIVSYGSLAPKRYMYSEVIKITSCRKNQLGKGGYGVVYKGRLHDDRLVAVKFLHDCKGNGDEFVNEVMSIGRTSHVNVVSLYGFCLEGSKRVLIYEYMPNGSLDKYIYSEHPKEILGWERLYVIAIGIARGLEYLHHSCNTRIVHFDIKPQNILLDKDFSPKIADFGLAKLCHTKESKLSMTGARGTIGFIAPEVHSRTFGVVSTKSDVYSYGMMLLEMVGGRRNVKSIVAKSSEKYFPDWIYDHFEQDDGLQACEVTREIEEIARKMTMIGLWCVQILPAYRPTITKVLEMFERSTDDMDMPPKQNFSGLLENSAHNMDVQSSSTRN